MRDSRVNYIAVGLFVLLMLAALIVALALLTGRTGPTAGYYTVYDNVGGLKFGTQVLFEGYPIGQVEGIEPVREEGRTRFRVNLSVQEGWPIPEGSVARVAASGLLSAVTIDIRAGTGHDVIAPGSLIPGQAGGSIFATLDEVAGEVQDLSQNSVRPLLDNLNRYVVAIGEALTGGAPEIMDDLRTVSADLAARTPAITRDLSRFAEKLNTRVLGPGNLKNVEATLANTEAATAEFVAMSRDLQALSAQVATLVATLDTLTQESRGDVRKVLADMRYALDSVARHIDSITYNLDGTSRNMLEFSRSIRQNPGLLIGGTPPVDEARPR